MKELRVSVIAVKRRRDRESGNVTGNQELPSALGQIPPTS